MRGLLVGGAGAVLLWLASSRGWVGFNGERFYRDTHIPVTSEQLMQLFRRASEVRQTPDSQP
jgi:hypothetical protein